MSSIFLSHNHHDKAFVKRLGLDLQENGIQVWIDEAEIKIGDSLIQKIESGIYEMEYLGVVLSEYSVNSEWVQREVNIALTIEIKNRQVKVLPILLKDCKIPAFLLDKRYADFREEINYAKGLENLLVVITQSKSNGIEFSPEKYTNYDKKTTLMSEVVAFPIFHYEATNNYLVVKIKNLSTSNSIKNLKVNVMTNIEFDHKIEKQSESRKVFFLEEKQEIALEYRGLFIDFDSFVANIGKKDFELSYLSMSDHEKKEAYEYLKRMGYLNWKQPSIGNLIITLSYNLVKEGEITINNEYKYPLNIWKYDHGVFIGLSHEDSKAIWPL